MHFAASHSSYQKGPTMRKQIISVVGIVLLTALIFGGCVERRVDRVAEGEKLMQLSREWAMAAQTDSVEKTLSYWADDAVVMAPGQPALKGKQAIREMIQGTSKMPGFRVTWEPLSVHVAKGGDLAYMIEKMSSP